TYTPTRRPSMSETDAKAPGKIGWIDLTVPNATEVRDFYQEVAGWTAQALSMGDYDDYCMNPPGADGAVCGICHARGANAGQPAVWMPYINVADLEASVTRCRERGGRLVGDIRSMGAAG